jgi:hypothetical protein
MVTRSHTCHLPFHSLQSTLFSNRPNCNSLLTAEVLVHKTYSSSFWQTYTEQVGPGVA